ncbi:MAG: hypothetical protein JWP31_1061, partial [Aeromicrobium sp.]|nr:hypothetical protein [Aeromicrobium sp.]
GSNWESVEKYGNYLKYALALAIVALIAWFVVYKVRSRRAPA